MELMQIVWLIAFVAFLVIEGLTMGLYSIWFAVGSVGALIAASIAPELYWAQIVVFLLLSGATLAGVRPFAQRALKSRKVGTNADINVGKIGKVIETICNEDATGAVYVYGKTWTARSSSDSVTIREDTYVKVLSIEGVKLIVEPAERPAAKV